MLQHSRSYRQRLHLIADEPERQVSDVEYEYAHAARRGLPVISDDKTQETEDSDHANAYAAIRDLRIIPEEEPEEETHDPDVAQVFAAIRGLRIVDDREDAEQGTFNRERVGAYAASRGLCLINEEREESKPEAISLRRGKKRGVEASNLPLRGLFTIPEEN